MPSPHPTPSYCPLTSDVSSYSLGLSRRGFTVSSSHSGDYSTVSSVISFATDYRSDSRNETIVNWKCWWESPSVKIIIGVEFLLFGLRVSNSQNGTLYIKDLVPTVAPSGWGRTRKLGWDLAENSFTLVFADRPTLVPCPRVPTHCRVVTPTVSRALHPSPRDSVSPLYLIIVIPRPSFLYKILSSPSSSSPSLTSKSNLPLINSPT